MFNRIKSSIRQIDLFSQPVELYLKKEASHKTMFGAFFSLGLIFLMSYIFFNLVRQMVDREDPSIQITQVYTPSPERMFFEFKNFTFSFGMENNTNFQTFLNESLVRTTFWAVHKYASTGPDGSSSINFDRVQIPITPCTMDSIGQPELKDYFQNYNLPAQYCIDFNKMPSISLEGTFDSADFRYLEVNVGMCQNETQTPGQPPCAPQEVIDAELGVVIFAFQITNTLVNLIEPYNPHQIIGKDIYTTISNKVFKHIDLYLQTVETDTEYGYVLSDNLQLKSLQYSNHLEQLDFIPQPDMFFRMMFRLTPSMTLNKRAYLNLMDILGSIGGIWQVLFFIVYLIVKPVNELSQRLIILNSLFNFDGQQKQIDEEELQPSQTINVAEKKEQEKPGSGRSISQGSIRQQKSLKVMSKSLSHFHKFKKKPQENFNVSEDVKRNQFQKNQMVSLTSIQVSGNNKLQPKETLKDLKRRMQTMSQQIKKYFKDNSKKLVLQTYDYVQIIFSCFSPSQDVKTKIEQIKFSSERVEKSMDIVNLIKKVNEIDKLKILLLNSDQIRMFDYVEKPTISMTPFEPDHDKEHQKYWSILKPKKSQMQAAIDAQKAYHTICKDKSIVNQKLIKMIDENVVKLFEIDLEDDETGEQKQKVAQPRRESVSECEYKPEDEEKFNPTNRQALEPPIFTDLVLYNQFLSPRTNRSQLTIPIVTVRGSENQLSPRNQYDPPLSYR